MEPHGRPRLTPHAGGGPGPSGVGGHGAAHRVGSATAAHRSKTESGPSRLLNENRASVFILSLPGQRAPPQLGPLAPQHPFCQPRALHIAASSRCAVLTPLTGRWGPPRTPSFQGPPISASGWEPFGGAAASPESRGLSAHGEAGGNPSRIPLQTTPGPES